MAAGARRRTGSQYALSVTGVAGPEAQDDVPVGMVFVGCADTAGCHVVHRQFLGDRARIRDFAAQMALDLLRKQLSKITA
jgi:nicotinamide-nucleotide amidase